MCHQLPLCQWHHCVKSSGPALACPTPPHRGAKPVSRICTPNCSRETSTEKEHSACAQVSLSPARLCSTEDASKCFPVPVISMENLGAITCTGQATLPPFSCKQCLGGQQVSSKELHNIPPNATWLGDTFLRFSSFFSLPELAKATTVRAGRKPFFLFYETATETVRLSQEPGNITDFYLSCLLLP